jgi:hypothetical protein
MKSKFILMLGALLLILQPGLFSQSRETGAIVGTVTDEEGAALPGVSVTLSSPSLMGIRSFVTEANGSYRFPALPPGQYTVKAEFQDFATVIRKNIRLTTTVRLTVDIIMKPAAVAEETTVIAQSPTVDIKSTETASVTLSDELLRNTPYSQFTADIVNLAPGVNNDVAFGASSVTGIAYAIDGISVADPEAGSAWVFLDHNIIEEAKVMGLGLPAEYGNFSGVIFNLITKSGGNQFSGHFEANLQGKKDDWPKGLWQAENNQAYIDDFPELTSPLARLLDVNAHLGGPILKDKLWFYVGLQYYNSQDFVTGFEEAIDYKQPRGFFKLTSQLSPNTNMTVFLELDTYNGVNRAPFAYTYSQLNLNTTLTQKSPEVVGNFSLTTILSPKSFFDLKGAFFWGRCYLDPEEGMDIPGHFSLNENKLYYNSYHYAYYDRSRFQVNASYTHYAEDFIHGDHDFKFGVEVERSFVRNRYGYTGDGVNDPLFGNTGLAHTAFFDYYGEPYLAYQYEGYDMNTYCTRVEAFAQDSWQIMPRLNINAGLRFSQNWGTVKGVDGVVYNTHRIAPRIGFTFDLFGDKTTVLKAHYGQFTEAMFSSYHDRLNPSTAFSDYVGYYWDYDTEEWVEFLRIVPEDRYKMAEDIKHPYMNQYVVGIERELFKDASLGVSFIYRQWKDIIGRYDLKADYELVDIFVPELNQSFKIYERTLGTVDTYEYILDNIEKGQPWISLDPYRKYWAIQFQFNKRFSNRWQLLASYVYSRAKGTIDNDFANDIGYSDRDELSTADPNFWINAEGNLTFDPTHQIKIQGTYVLPFDISLNAYFRAVSGNRWTTRYWTSRLNQGRVTFYAEPRGSNQYPMQKVLDVRLEKVFTLAEKYRLGLILDVFNVFNADTITNWGTRIGYDWVGGNYPSTDGHELYGIVNPRQVRLGLRLMF